MRMGGAPQLADLLPGALFGQLTPKPTLQRLPAAEIPQPIRDQDPDLAFSPVIRLDWGEFTITFGLPCWKSRFDLCFCCTTTRGERNA